MSERYRLVFRGEVLDGQHKAVVKQRLGATLKVDGERLDAMFTGKAVTIRKDADTDTAVRFQIAFKKAGARLRVLPVAVESDAEAVSGSSPAQVSASSTAQVSAPSPAQASAPPPPAPAAANTAFQLAPRGALMAEPAPAAPRPAVDLTHLTLAAPGVVLGVPRSVASAAPDVSHLTIAAAGADLGVAPPPLLQIEAPTWDVADAGADLGPLAPLIEPPFELDAIEFELAPVGTSLAEADDEPLPKPPDTSHLRLQ